MKQFKSIFSISLSQELAYRFNFIMWRFRSILQILVAIFLWDSVFSDNQQLLGYTRESIFTYIFMVLIIKAVVFSSKSGDIAGEISQGVISNYLLRPVNFLKYWAIRDSAAKVVNVVFSIGEAILLFALFKPTLFIQTNGVYLLLFIVSIGLACMLYFLLTLIFSSGTFWIPEQAWGMMFLLLVFSELLGGTLYPLDVFPTIIQQVVYATPFPYLIFVPIQIYLGKLPILLAVKAIVLSLAWVAVLYALAMYLWKKGLRAYEGVGR